MGRQGGSGNTRKILNKVLPGGKALVGKTSIYVPGGPEVGVRDDRRGVFWDLVWKQPKQLW